MWYISTLLYLTCAATWAESPAKTSICVRKHHTGQHEISTKADTFKELIEDSTLFIDRSLLIKELIETPHQVTVVTCSKRWGKSINLDMIKTFFEIEVDPHGHPISPRENTRNYKIFKRGHITWMRKTVAWLQNPMLIANTDLFDRYIGQHPVIHIELKDIVGEGFVDVFKSLTAEISNVYRHHHYLGAALLRKTNDPNATTEQRQKAKGNLDKFNTFIFDQEFNPNVTHNCLKFLSELLYDHFGKKAIVLIDNYEKPIIRLFYDRDFIRLYTDDVLDFFTQLFTATLKDNEYLEKAVISGTFPTCTEIILSQIPDYAYYTVMLNPWAEFYGLHEHTVDQLLGQLNLTEDEHESVHTWYCGYQMGTGLDLHNPWSIVGFINHRVFRSYWLSPEDTLFLMHILPIRPMRDLFESLANYGNVTLHLKRMHFDKADLITFRDLELGDVEMKLDSKLVDLILARLWSAAQLSYSGKSYDSWDNTIYLELPNYELLDEIVTRLFWLYQMKDHISCISMDSILDHFIKFVYNDHLTSKPLEYELGNLLHLHNVYLEAFRKKSKTKELTVNVHFFRTLVNYFALELRHEHRFNVRTYFQTGHPELVFDDDDIGVVVKFDFNSFTGKLVWQKVKNFTDIFDNKDHIKTVKVIGIAISDRCYVNIFSKTHHKC